MFLKSTIVVPGSRLEAIPIMQNQSLTIFIININIEFESLTTTVIGR